MAFSKDSKSAAVRAKLHHPVIDGDGHWLEPIPIFLDFLRDVGGPAIVDKFMKKAKDTSWYEMAPAERLERRPHRPTWWGEPGNSLDRATAMVPRLFYERLDDFGIDFALVYTSLGLFYVSNPDEDLRRAAARAVKDPGAHARQYIDSLGLESPYDYDPFWARCAELEVAVTAHSGSMGWNGRESINSFTYNHIGHFANASHAFAKALALGGVTHRFPQLRFAFLEGDVGWACNLVAALIGHWERRRKEAVESQVRPSNLDLQTLKDLFARYGGRVYEEKMDEMLACLSLVEPFKTVEELTERAYRGRVDDFAAVPAASAEELRRHFAERFYFGCEADDVMTAWAFDKHGHHRLRPIFSSDVGHFDVVDMTEVLEEAYEMVEHGLITEAELREFVFSNPARLHTTMNPDFFKGTVVEAAVARELAG